MNLKRKLKKLRRTKRKSKSRLLMICKFLPTQIYRKARASELLGKLMRTTLQVKDKGVSIISYGKLKLNFAFPFVSVKTQSLTIF